MADLKDRRLGFRHRGGTRPPKCWRKDSNFDLTRNEDIHVELLAGMAAAPPDSSDAADDFDDALNRSGWYVVCNGRIVLAADMTSVKGWGTEGYGRSGAHRTQASW